MAKEPTTAVVILALTVLFGCAADSEKKAASPDIAAEFVKVQQARSALEAARSSLEAVRAELNALMAKGRLSAEETERKAELESRLSAAERAFEEAYDKDQSVLSSFLTFALNDDALKSAPQTRQALRLYADEALLNARDRVDKSGDYAKAIEILQTAESYYEFAELAVPQDLRESREQAQRLRYLTKDRFDLLKKGMTPDEVKAITGNPLYANVRETVAQGRKITMWLFPRDPAVGGASAIYFDKGKVYAMKWDAAAK